MKLSDALPYVSFCITDALSVLDGPVPDHARLVGWQCGFEPLFVAVYSYIPGVRLEDDEAEEIATEFLQERRWFTDCDNPPEADFVL